MNKDAEFALNCVKEHSFAIPEHMREGLIEYIRIGRPVGDFLFAVLSNDLVSAMLHADIINCSYMIAWARLLTYLPVAAWGSPDNVRKWMAQGGLEGMSKCESENPSS